MNLSSIFPKSTLKSGNDNISYTLSANLKRNVEFTGGKIKMAENRFIFLPHFLNIQRNEVEIYYCNIQKISKSKILFFDTALNVLLKNGESFNFVLGLKRANFISKLIGLNPNIIVE